MILEAVIEEQVYRLNVPDSLLASASDFFARLDRDMDNGWQMSRDWVAHPDQVQRAQIVADKLLTALENEDHKLGMLMAGYLLNRLPGLSRVELDVQGEIQNTGFRFAPPAEPKTPPEAADTPNTQAALADKITATAERCRGAPRGLSKLDAMAQAGQDVTKVFKMGRGYRFSVFDHASQSWQDGPLTKSQEEADRLRQKVFRARFEALQRSNTDD